MLTVCMYEKIKLKSFSGFYVLYIYQSSNMSNTMNEMNAMKNVSETKSIFDDETVILTNKLSNKETEMDVFVYWCLKECYNNGVIEEHILKSVMEYLHQLPLNVQCDFHSNFKENLKVIRLDFQRTVFPDTSVGGGGGGKNKDVSVKKKKTKKVESIENEDADNTKKPPKVQKQRKTKKTKEECPTVILDNNTSFVQTAIVAASVSDKDFIHILSEQGPKCESILGGGSKIVEAETETETEPEPEYPTGNIVMDESEILHCEERFEPLLNNELLEEKYDDEGGGDDLNSNDIDDLIGMVSTMVIQSEPNVSGGGGVDSIEEGSEIRIEIVPDAETEVKPKKKRISKKHNGVGTEVVAVVENVEVRFEEWFTQHFGLHESPAFVDKSIHISALRSTFMEESGIKITVALCTSVVERIAGVRDKTNKKTSSGIFSSDGKTYIQGWCNGV